MQFLARKSGSAEAGSSVVVVPTPADPAGIRTCARDLRTWSAANKHTDEERGGRHDPGVRRPGVVSCFCFRNLAAAGKPISENKSSSRGSHELVKEEKRGNWGL